MIFEEDSPENVTRPIRTMQIIAMTLVLGAVLFLCVVLFIRHNQTEQADAANPAAGMPMISLVSVFVLLSQTPLAFLLPRNLIRGAMEKLAITPANQTMIRDQTGMMVGPVPDDAFLVRSYQTGLIMRMALFEGSSFMGSIAYLLEGSPIGLGVSVAGIVLMLAQWPANSRIFSWLQQRAGELEDLRERKSRS